MKKIMFAAALAVAFAATAEIESANTVGYTTTTIAADTYYLIGVQFTGTGSTTEKIDMNSLMKLSASITPGTYDSDFVGAPQIQVLKASGGYKSYFYISDATDDNDDPLGYNCWADIDGYELTSADELSLASGFWFKASTAGTLSVAGQVLGSASKVVSFPADTFYIMSSPYPQAFSLANVTTTGVTPGTYAADFANCASIQVLKATGGYKSYFYISDATDDNDDEVGYNCWADIDGYILDGNQVEAGASFWIKSPTAGSMGFSL